VSSENRGSILTFLLVVSRFPSLRFFVLNGFGVRLSLLSGRFFQLCDNRASVDSWFSRRPELIPPLHMGARGVPCLAPRRVPPFWNRHSRPPSALAVTVALLTV